ncbi:MAG: nucleotidyl transferase AbiEii/AbiGii toxin family protein [Proteobacteria bacterium]|nr:nucleotidyl transferase AbiEii/AbiGii toxin family protein [Pseudomonadota bacterium]
MEISNSVTNWNVDNLSEFRQQILDATDLLKLKSPAFIEKDFYVTQLIHALSEIKNPHYYLYFQGGTCLSKAYRITERMSEDCDFRIALQPGVSFKRETLRQFRQTILQVLRENGFYCSDDVIRVRNLGQFMELRIPYRSIYSQHSVALKPYLAVEFFLNTVKLPTQNQPITTLMRQTLGATIQHPIGKIDCVSPLETAAEKWVALTRRIATMDYRTHYQDTSLVRHLYDLYRIEQSGYSFDESMAKLVMVIIEGDRQQYRNHNPAYFANPSQEIRRALQVLKESKAWQSYWDAFMLDMVFGERPAYADVVDNFIGKSEKILHSLEMISWETEIV